MLPVVILAAGRGVRLGAVGRKHRKVLLPVGDGTLLEQHLRVFMGVGARRFIVVVDGAGEAIASEARRLATTLEVAVEFVVQERPQGIGHATLLAGPLVGDSPFVLVLGDTYYVPADLAGGIAKLERRGFDAVLSVRPVDDPALIRRECTIEVDGAGLVRRIVEKPSVPLSSLKPCGVYLCGPRLLEALAVTPPSSLRGEIELTDAIQRLIDAGGRVAPHANLSVDVNVTTPLDLLEANLEWLSRRPGGIFIHGEATVAADASLDTCVVGRGARVEAGAVLTRTVVFPDAVVAAATRATSCLVLSDVGLLPLSAAPGPT